MYVTPACRRGATVEDENVKKVHFQQTHSRYGDQATVHCSAGTQDNMCHVHYVLGVYIYVLFVLFADNIIIISNI